MPHPDEWISPIATPVSPLPTPAYESELDGMVSRNTSIDREQIGGNEVLTIETRNHESRNETIAAVTDHRETVALMPSTGYGPGPVTFVYILFVIGIILSRCRKN